MHVVCFAIVFLRSGDTHFAPRHPTDTWIPRPIGTNWPILRPIYQTRPFLAWRTSYFTAKTEESFAVDVNYGGCCSPTIATAATSR